MLTSVSALAPSLAAGSEPSAAATTLPRSPLPLASDAPVAARIIVRFTDGASAAERAAVVAAVGGYVDQEIPALGLVRIAIPADGSDSYGQGRSIADFVAQQPAVASAESDATLRVDFTPNDQYYATDPYVGLGQWGIRKAQVDRAWDTVRSSPMTIAVIDTGVDPGHPDLAGALLPGRSFLTSLSTGCTSAANDDNSHGTHVTGIIAANAGNGIGIAGVAFGAKILPLKALDCEGSGQLSDVAQALVFATDQGARIINISLGSSADSPTLRSALQYATSRNVLVVISAGNCGGAPLSPRCSALNETSYPAAYPEALAVSATASDDTKATFSTQGPYVDVSAPGQRIVSTTPTYGTKVGTLSYAAFSGTSQAAPFVAGLAALIWTREPTLSATQVRERILSTADDLGAPGSDAIFGSGRVNALRAVSVPPPGPARLGVTYGLAGVPRTAVAGGSVAANVLLTNTSSFAWPAAGISAVKLTYSWIDAAGATILPGTPVPLAADVAPGATAAVPVRLAVPARHGTFTLRFDLIDGAQGTWSSRGVPAGQVSVAVGAGTYGASYAPPAAATAATIGVAGTLEVRLTNTGSIAWPATGPTPVRLSYHWIDAFGRVAVWDGQRTPLPRDIAPGETVLVALAYAPPPSAGAYTLRIDLVHEGVSWFSGLGVASRDVAVPVSSGYGAQYTMTVPPAVLAGGRLRVPITVRNVGTLAWRSAGANPIRLAAHVADSQGNTVLWDGERTAFSADVAPGASVTTELIVAAPLAPGVYRVRADLVHEGIAWFSGAGVAAGDTFLAVLSDFRATLPSGPLTVSRAAPAVSVMVTNSSSATWTTGGAASVALSSHWLDAAGRVLVWDGPRAPLPRAVAPGESITIGVPLGTVPPGAAQVVIDVVADGLRWFAMGAARPVTLTP